MDIIAVQFMKRTREKTEILDEEEMRSQLFDSEVGSGKVGAVTPSPRSLLL